MSRTPKAMDKTEEEGRPDSTRVASVVRAFEILSAFEHAPASLTLNELADRTGLYKSTILRLADTLIEHEFLMRAEDGTYQIGPRPFLLGARYQSSVIPAEWILPVLRELAAASGESAAFNVRNGDYRVCLWRVDSPRLIRDHTQPGDIRPLGTGAAGKLLEAFARREDPRYEELRRLPLSRSFGEVEADMAGLGVPVFGPLGDVRGVITLSGPSSRFTPEAMAVMEKLLWDAALRLTRRIGGDVAAFQVQVDPK